MRTVRRLWSITGIRLYSTGAPIRVAYFGTDRFSSVSLDALAALKKDRPDVISDICVITRPPKFTGRKRDILKESHVSLYCKSRNLPFLTADNKAQISELNLTDIDLAIAVSYGLLIPGSFLSTCRYGGINLHPSFLPALSGPSPISSAILRGLHYTGVTIQTLHPTKFDEGKILLQSNPVPISGTDTSYSLLDKLAAVGAQSLVQTIRERRFDTPRSESSRENEAEAAAKDHFSASTTSKVTRASRQILWNDPDKGTGQFIDRQIRALGCSSPLWTQKYFFKTQTVEDVQLDGMEVLTSEKIPHWMMQLQAAQKEPMSPGSFHVNPFEFKDQHLYICPLDPFQSTVVRVERVKRQGKEFVTGRDFALSCETDWSRHGKSHSHRKRNAFHVD